MAINISGIQFNDKRLLPLIRNIFYDKVTIIKKVSKLLTGSATDELVPMETYVCTECSHINKEFNILGNEK